MAPRGVPWAAAPRAVTQGRGQARSGAPASGGQAARRGGSERGKEEGLRPGSCLTPPSPGAAAGRVPTAVRRAHAAGHRSTAALPAAPSAQPARCWPPPRQETPAAALRPFPPRSAPSPPPPEPGRAAPELRTGSGSPPAPPRAGTRASPRRRPSPPPQAAHDSSAVL